MIANLVETAVSAIRDRMLRPQFNAMLELVYAQAGDPTINLERVEDNRYYISEGIEPLQPPAIFIVAESSDHDLNAQNFAWQKHNIFVAAVFEDLEAQRLQRKGWRYAQALWLALHDQSTANIKVLVRSVDYGPTLVAGPTSARAFRKDVTLRCEVLHAEAFV
jgi:hypothetical protein